MLRRIVIAALLLALPPVVAPADPVPFDVRCVDQVLDLHGDPSGADLVLFVGGNQWMVMPALIAAFQKSHPQIKHVFYETLPPGILAAQIRAGSLRVNDLEISSRADVYLSGLKRMQAVHRAGYVGDIVPYAANTLAILVPSRNAKHVSSLRDLGRPDVRVAMPNPKWEGVARQIEGAYRRAGGDTLNQRIMQTKVASGTTRLTRIHHRQTPMWLLDGSADAGVVWLTEALYQERIGSGLRAVRIPAKENAHGQYVAAVVKRAAHPTAARDFVLFLTSAAGQAIYRSFGFEPPTTEKE